MYSVSIFSATLLILFVTANAFECESFKCRLYCANGYLLDAQGCMICECYEVSSSTTDAPATGTATARIFKRSASAGSTTGFYATGSDSTTNAPATGTATARIFKRSASSDSTTESSQQSSSTQF